MTTEIKSLALSRKLGEKIVIGQDIRITVIKVEGSRVILLVRAPADVPVNREEIFNQKIEEYGEVLPQ